MDQKNLEREQSPGFSTPKYKKENSSSVATTPCKKNALKRKSSEHNIMPQSENSGLKRIKRQPFLSIHNNSINFFNKEQKSNHQSFEKFSEIQKNSYENNYEITDDENSEQDKSQTKAIFTLFENNSYQNHGIFESETEISNTTEAVEQIQAEKNEYNRDDYYIESNMKQQHQTDENNNNDEGITKSFYAETFNQNSENGLTKSTKESFHINKDSLKTIHVFQKTCQIELNNCEAQTKFQIEPYASNQEDVNINNNTEIYLTENCVSGYMPNNSEIESRFQINDNQSNENKNNNQLNECVTKSIDQIQEDQNIWNQINSVAKSTTCQIETEIKFQFNESNSESYAQNQVNVINNYHEAEKYINWNQITTTNTQTFETESLTNNSETIFRQYSNNNPVEENTTAESKGEEWYNNELSTENHQFSQVENISLPLNDFYQEKSPVIPLVVNNQHDYAVEHNDLPSRSAASFIAVDGLLNLGIQGNIQKNNDYNNNDDSYDDENGGIRINVVAGSSTSSKPKAPKRVKSPSSEKIDYAITKILEIFTADEIRTGVFLDKNNKTNSKTRNAFDIDKTADLKNAIAQEYNIEDENIEDEWNRIRSKLNVRVKALSGQVRFKKHFGIN